MKKKLQKFGVVLLSMLLAFGTVLPVFADDPTPGSITIHKYNVTDEKRVDFDKNVTGKELTGDDLANALGGATALSGVKFTIEKIATGSISANMASLTENQIKALAADTTFGTNGVKEGTTGTDGTIAFTGLADGVYRITEYPTDLITKSLRPFLVTIPFVDPEDTTGTTLLRNVHVYPKNVYKQDQPGIEKYVGSVGQTSDSVGYTNGDDKTANFIIDVDVPTDIGSETTSSDYKFEVKDTIDSKLNAPTSIEVYGVKDDGTVSSKIEEGSTTYTKTIEGQVLTVNFANGVDKGSKTPVDWKDYKKIRITFSCSLNMEEVEKAMAEGNYTTSVTIPNKAYLSYTNSLGTVVWTGDTTPGEDEPGEPKSSEEVEVHTTAIKLLKVDGNNENLKLSGAVFELYDKDMNKIATASGNAITGTSEITGKSNSEGIVLFTGIPYDPKDNDGSGTIYYVKEITAPTGYQVYSKTYEVKASGTISAVTVVNYRQFVLPGTGLTGTHLMMIGLASIVAGVAGFVMLKKKRA